MGRAIVRQADLFLFDEPLSNLDAALRAQVRVDIRKLHDKLNATSVYVTHDQVEAMTLADVIFVLNKGLVEQSGPPLEIFDKPTTKFVAGFLGSPAMNFIDGQIVREGQSITFQARGGLVVPIDATTFGPDLDPGRNVTLGVRPHEVSLAESVNSVGKLAVSVVEALGAETYAHGELGTSSFVARLEATTSIKKGASFPIAFRSIHLFDATSGQSLRAR
jgi:sn-glycerol 3-phosphate transport system ATP-binding protein/multiple sugar transport system ATP-binding protein